MNILGMELNANIYQDAVIKGFLLFSGLYVIQVLVPVLLTMTGIQYLASLLFVFLISPAIYIILKNWFKVML